MCLLQCSSPPPPCIVHRMEPAAVAAVPPGAPARPPRRRSPSSSEFPHAVDRPSPPDTPAILPNEESPHLSGKLTPSSTSENSHHVVHLSCIYRISNKKWTRLGTPKNVKSLLLISGIESNPGPPHSQTLAVSHININSITANNKIDELNQFTDANDIKVLALTETKLDSTIDDSLYTINGFHSPLTKHRTRHGGEVALYFHSSLPVQRLQHLDIGGEEWVWAIVKTKFFSIIICCLYLPPNLNANRLTDFIENFTEAVNQTQRHAPTATIILGDFNAGNAYMPEHMNFKSSGTTSFDYLLKEAGDSLDFCQLIREPTRISDNSSNLRDLIFTNNTEIIMNSGTLPSFSQLDHFPIFVTLNLTPPPDKTDNTKLIWDFANMDAPLLTRLLMDTDWQRILENDIESATDEFTNTLINAARVVIPTKSRTTTSRQKPWVTAFLKRHIRKRERLFKIAKQKNTEYNWERWRNQRNIVTSLNRRLKNEYMQIEVNKLLAQKTDPQKYHQTLRRILGRPRTDTMPPLETSDGEIITDDYSKATLLNNHFARQSTLDLPDSHQPPHDSVQNTPVPTLENISTSEKEVLAFLNSLDPNKTTGPDQIPVKLLKMTALIIAKPLSDLFNKSLRTGIYPSKFKIAHIRPIYKNKGSPSDYSCYRPISILSTLSKVIEKIVYKNIYTHLTDHSLLTEKQSGYRKYHSTEQQLLYLTHNIYKSLDTGKDFTAIFLDIAKYFDKIWHKGLLFKCKNDFGLSGKLLEWLESYLKDRHQSVKINDTLSAHQIINAGCPQGSVLGPLLALMYLDGLSKQIKNDILLFADDTSLYAFHETTDLRTIQLSLQDDLDTIHKYGRDWAITFNTAKTVQLTFSLKRDHKPPKPTFGGDNVPLHNSHKHLGITFSKDLRFHDHIKETCKKSQQRPKPIIPRSTVPAAAHSRSNLQNLHQTTL